MSTPAVTVVIVNFNAGARLKKCLDHLAAQTFRAFEVIVIDNASTDGSLAEAEKSAQAFRLIEAGANLGFAAANNRAVKDARGALLAFLNPDAYPFPDWLAELIAAAERYPGVEAFGSTQLNAADPSRIDGAGDVFHVFGIPYRGHFGWPAAALPPEGECFAPCAAAALYRRRTFEELGGFDERFFCYGEDVDLGFRLRLAGGRVVQVRAARVLHEGSGVTGRYSDFTVYHGNRNSIWTTYKNMPGAIYWPLFPLHVAVNLYFLARAFSIGAGRAYWRALRDGFGRLGEFSGDRRRLQRARKASLGDLAQALAWSPLKVSRRAAVIRPIADARTVILAEPLRGGGDAIHNQAMTAMSRPPLLEKALWRARAFILAEPLRGDDAARVEGPLVVAGFFRTASGVGQSARRCAAALERHGEKPVCVDLSEIFNQVDIDADRALSPMPDDDDGVLILNVNAPETERALFKLGLLRPKHWRIIGVWAWELAIPPPNWLPVARRLSEIWTLSAFVADAFRGRVAIPVTAVAPFIAAPEIVRADRARFGVGENDIVCLAMADGRSSFERKNILAAARIFCAAAADNPKARLIVKTRNSAEFPEFADALSRRAAGEPRIIHIDAALSESERWSLIAATDIFLSPHRSEGFGLALAEAMALGKAVLATGWSGNLDFMTRENAALIPYALGPVPEDVAVYGGIGRDALWAEPDERIAADLLRELLDLPDRRAELGAKAQTMIGQALNGRAYLEALAARSRR